MIGMETLLFIQTPVIPWIKDIFRPLQIQIERI